MSDLTQTLYRQMREASELDKAIRENMEALGYGDKKETCWYMWMYRLWVYSKALMI